MYREFLVNLPIFILALILFRKFGYNRIKLRLTIIEKQNIILLISLVFSFVIGNLVITLTLLLILLFLYRESLFSKKYFIKTKIEYFKVTIIVLIIIWPLLFVVSIISKKLFYDYSEQHIVSTIRELKSYSEILPIFITAVIISPIIEEIAFRGFIYRSLKTSVGPFFSAVVSSLLFSTIHLNLLSFPYLFILGFTLCIYYEAENSIIMPIFIHSALNLIMLLLILASK